MKHLILLTVILLGLSFNSCQQEEDTQVIDTSQSLTKDAALSLLVMRVAQNPTFLDNCIDDNGCFSVVLPVTIMLNGHIITVMNENDYELVKSIKNQSNMDDDIVHFDFPIALKYPNYHEIVVNNQNEYNSFVAGCGPDNNYHEIKCIGFNYPVKINCYNKTYQVATTIAVSGNIELYNFVSALKNDEIYSVVYPLTMTKTNGSIVSFNTNDQLKDGIEDVINDCNIPNGGNSPLQEILTQGTWRISNFVENGHDETFEFADYTFTFNPNGTSIAVRNSASVNGNWNIHPNGGSLIVDLNFEGNSLRKIEEDWRVVEYSPTLIKLRHQSGGGGGGGGNEYLDLSKN